MYVVVDANILVREGFGGSALFEFFLSSSHLTNYKICVPALVFTEVTAQFHRTLDKEANSARGSLDKLSRLLSRSLSSSLDDLDQRREADIFRSRLESRISNARSTVLGYPNVAHEKVVGRAIGRKRPFDAKGSGYRDTLIWNSVLELASKDTDSIVLVSGDKAFGDGNGQLHRELSNELSDLGHGEARVSLVPSLSTFVERYVRPQLREVIRDKPFESLEKLGVGLESLIVGRIHDEFYEREIFPQELKLGPQYKVLSLEKVGRLVDLHDTDRRELDGDSVLLRLSAIIRCEFEVWMRVGDAHTSRELLNIPGYNVKWTENDYTMKIITPSLQCNVDMTITGLSAKNIGAQVLSSTLEATNEPIALQEWTP